MALTYTKTRWSSESTEHTLTAPRHWACFTSATNTSLRKKAETVIKKLEAATSMKQVRGAIVSFVAGWDRMCNNPRHQKAGVSDTAVRECVWAFVENACEAVGYDHCADTWWEEGQNRNWKLRS